MNTDKKFRIVDFGMRILNTHFIRVNPCPSVV
jgi:hypothetical protein